MYNILKMVFSSRFNLYILDVDFSSSIISEFDIQFFRDYFIENYFRKVEAIFFVYYDENYIYFLK